MIIRLHVCNLNQIRLQFLHSSSICWKKPELHKTWTTQNSYAMKICYIYFHIARILLHNVLLQSQSIMIHTKYIQFTFRSLCRFHKVTPQRMCNRRFSSITTIYYSASRKKTVCVTNTTSCYTFAPHCSHSIYIQFFFSINLCFITSTCDPPQAPPFTLLKTCPIIVYSF